MAFTLPWSVNKLVSTHINNGNAINDATYGTSSLKNEGKTLLIGDTRIVGNTTAGNLTATSLIPTNRNELSNNKYIGSTPVTLNWGDPENIIFNGNGNWTVTLPSVVSGGIARVGAKFTFGFTYPWTGTKTITVPSTQYIYDGGTSLTTSSINLIASSNQNYIQLLCVNYTPGNICWAVVARPFNPTTAYDFTASSISLTNRNSLLTNRYLQTATATLALGDPEQIFFGLNGNQSVTLPSVVGVSGVLGTRFIFGLVANQSGTKTIQAQTSQFIYDGGTNNSRTSLTMSITTDYFYTLVCVNQTAGQPCWAVVARAINPSLPYTFPALQTFNGGLTASLTQTINFGGNAPTMSGANISATSIPNSALQTQVVRTDNIQIITAQKTFTVPPSMEGTNISGVVKTTGNENIDGIKNFISPPVMSGASITATSIPNSALQTSVVLTNNTQTITGAKTFTVAPTMSGTNIALASIPSNSLIGADIDTVLFNTSFGETTGYYTGGSNSAFGSLAMQQGTLVTGSQNSAFGANAMGLLESGGLNCAYGVNSLSVLGSGSSNSCYGHNSGSQLVSQSNNTLIGQGCGSIGTFTNCTGLGQNVQFSNGVTNSTAIGRGTVCSNSNSIQLGDGAITVRIDGALLTPTPVSTSNSTNAATTAFVYGKIRVDDVLNNQSCGSGAGASYTTGYENVSIASLSNHTMSTGYRNVSIGHSSSQYHNGFQNVAIGFSAMSSSVGQVPTNNVAIGAYSLSSCQTGADGNFALGGYSLGTLSFGTNNLMCGYYTGGALTTGNYNCGLSYGALNTITTGDRNCGIGVGCGGGILTGSKNTFLGDNTSATGDFSNSTAIGADSQITASNQIVIGTANESIFVRGCTYLKSSAPIQTGSFTISSTLIYENYPINITATSTVTLPAASAALVGVTIRFRRVAGSAVALNSASSNIRPGTSVTTSNAVILTASNTTSAGNSNLLICLALTASTYSWHTAT